jgi:hypothetical protein
MTCGCSDDKKLDEIKRFSLESMQSLSIDEIINLYRHGYILEGTEFVEPGIMSQSVSNIETELRE